MENKKITISRYFIYKNAADVLNRESGHSDNINVIKEHFKIATMLFRDIEKDENVLYGSANDFRRIITKNCKNLLFNNLFEAEYFNKTDVFILEIKEDDVYKELLVKFIKVVSSIHNKAFNKSVISDLRSNVNERNYDYLFKDNNIFLSYAYVDKGLSYALFLYFITNNSFLYVDWMWNDNIAVCIDLKNELQSKILKCKQFLFLRSPNCEYDVKGKSQIRHWCSWETGIAFEHIKEEKYFINFSRMKSNNFFLEDLKEMKSIDYITGRIG